jgi:hypothetical protein
MQNFILIMKTETTKLETLYVPPVLMNTSLFETVAACMPYHPFHDDNDFLAGVSVLAGSTQELLDRMQGSGAETGVSKIEDSRDLHSASNNFRESSAPKPPIVIALTSVLNFSATCGTLISINYKSPRVCQKVWQNPHKSTTDRS